MKAGAGSGTVHPRFIRKSHETGDSQLIDNSSYFMGPMKPFLEEINSHIALTGQGSVLLFN